MNKRARELRTNMNTELSEASGKREVWLRPRRRGKDEAMRLLADRHVHRLQGGVHCGDVTTVRRCSAFS